MINNLSLFNKCLFNTFKCTFNKAQGHLSINVSFPLHTKVYIGKQSTKNDFLELFFKTFFQAINVKYYSLIIFFHLKVNCSLLKPFHTSGLVYCKEYRTRMHVTYTPLICRANSWPRSCWHTSCISSCSPWGRAFWLGSWDTMSKQWKVFVSHVVTAWHNKGLIFYLDALLFLRTDCTYMYNAITVILLCERYYRYCKGCLPCFIFMGQTFPQGGTCPRV